MVTCYLGIGSNQGKRRENIRAALKKIKALKDTRVLKFSKIIESAAQGGPKNQGKFLNAALKIDTALSPVALLKQLKKLERELGRTKTVRWGSRPIDLDILFYGDKIIKRKDLIIPHPRILERAFVVVPLLEVL